MVLHNLLQLMSQRRHLLARFHAGSRRLTCSPLLRYLFETHRAVRCPRGAPSRCRAPMRDQKPPGQARNSPQSVSAMDRDTGHFATCVKPRNNHVVTAVVDGQRLTVRISSGFRPSCKRQVGTTGIGSFTGSTCAKVRLSSQIPGRRDSSTSSPRWSSLSFT